eukprot:6206854-Pleurochrysis_carterae.AAC.1
MGQDRTIGFVHTAHRKMTERPPKSWRCAVMPIELARKAEGFGLEHSEDKRASVADVLRLSFIPLCGANVLKHDWLGHSPTSSAQDQLVAHVENLERGHPELLVAPTVHPATFPRVPQLCQMQGGG